MADAMTNGEYREFDCDLCGSADAVELEVLRRYTDGQPIHVCRNCGFVYVRGRRSAKSIADTWSKETFQTSYAARIPAVKARHMYLAEFIDTNVGLADRKLCDIGGGEGQFLDLVRGPDYGADVFAIEPSADNCRRMEGMGIPSFNGTIEDFRQAPEAEARRFDIVTIMWTLENCQSCRSMLDAAWNILEDGGYLMVVTGSRLLVPFKKPLHYYVPIDPVDTHCFRFSANTLQGLLAVSGFEVAHVNRYIDTDYLVMIGRKVDSSHALPWNGDDYREIVDLFRRSHSETEQHFKDA
jgi:hypothetical protein